MCELTVIIPSYNMQSGAVRAIRSVLDQEIEARILVVDDFSQPPISLPQDLTDNARIALIHHNVRKGASGARNTGISACETPWLSFLDSDDVLLTDTLKTRFDFAKEHGQPNTLYGCGWVEKFGLGGAEHVRTPLGATMPEHFASGCWYNPGSCIITRKGTFENRLFNETLDRMEDLEWGLEFGLDGGALVICEVAGVAVKPSNRTNLNAVQQAADAILNAHQGLSVEQPKVWRALNAYLQYEITAIAVREKRPFKAALHLAKSLFWKPRLRKHLSPGWVYRSV